MSELSAAMGLAVLPHVSEIIKERKNIIDFYLANLKPNKIQKFTIHENCKWNYSYFPVLFKSKSELELKLEKLNSMDVFPRKYFSPSLNKIEYVNYQSMPISEDVSSRILCLPLYVGLEQFYIQKIVNIINE
jgi:dTDP-4-amino-4,6-dideoxygalactose transaminase